MCRIYTGFMNHMYDIFTAIFVGMNHVNPIDTGKITENLFVIRTGTANFYIYKSKNNMISFDAGFGKNHIINELHSLNIDPGCITHIFLTHSDFDHADGVSLFKNAKVYLSSDEEQMITRRKARMSGFIYNSKVRGKYYLLNDNDVITVGTTKIKAIATPGHTPGSMSYLVNDSILIVGDSFRIINGKVCTIKYYNMDTKKQEESIRKLARLKNVKIACTGHRGYTKKFNEAIRGWK